MNSKITGFMEIDRKNFAHRDVEVRIKDFNSVYQPLTDAEMKSQATRCMDCGTSFCNWGCPLGNLIPEWNDLIFNGNWEKAYHMLSLTANFPEFTGRVCPALCESACVLGLNREAVSIREIEQTIAEKAFEKGWVKPRTPKVRTGKKVAIVGSGPAGLAAADELNAMGHIVTVFEREKNIGGLMRYGIPNYKLEKSVIDRRVQLMKESGIIFMTGIEIGKQKLFEAIINEYDAVILACGTWVPRDLKIPGRDLRGIHFAVDFLRQQTMRLTDETLNEESISAEGKTVLVIGGGDTGADCVGTANRQGAKQVYQFEILPKPLSVRDESMPWPTFPRIYKHTTSHEEGCVNEWEISTKEFHGKKGQVKGVKGSKIKWFKGSDGRYACEELEGTQFELDVDLVLIAAGFLHTEHDSFINRMKIKLDHAGNVDTDEKNQTNLRKVFATGDMRTGQSLVVKAIYDGRMTAEHVNEYLNATQHSLVV